MDNWLRSIAANLVMPLMDAGQRRAEVRRTFAQGRERLLSYRQSLLTAWQETEDALARESELQKRVESIRSQRQLAEETYQHLRLEYLNGISDFLDVLTALIDAQELEREMITARLELFVARVSLYRALAGPVPELEENNQIQDNLTPVLPL